MAQAATCSAHEYGDEHDLCDHGDGDGAGFGDLAAHRVSRADASCHDGDGKPEAPMNRSVIIAAILFERQPPQDGEKDAERHSKRQHLLHRRHKLLQEHLQHILHLTLAIGYRNMKGKPTATHRMVVGLCPLGERGSLVNELGGQRLPIALRLRLALLGRFRIRPVARSPSPLRGLSHGQVSSGQRLPIALRLRLALLGRFRIRAVAQSASPFQGSLLGRLSITSGEARS